MANLAAIAAARQAKDYSSDRLRIYASSETHFSVAKAAALLGIGRENVRHVPVDDHFRIRVDDLVAKITADLEVGHLPFCVVANAGTVNTGAVDSLAEIREIADRFKLWMHVDGSYGAFAVLAESARKLFAGIERADSVAFDPHKWLYLPVDVGCVIYRDPEIARAAFAHEAEYTRIIAEEADEAFAFWDYGPELSRRFRALKVWMLLKGVGLDYLGEAIESNLACARHLESMVRASNDFEMVAPIELSIFCFRHVSAQLRNGSPQAIDAFNERLLIALQRDGSSYLSNATLGGRFALRGCVLNYRTTSPPCVVAAQAELARRSSLGASAFVAGGAQRFHLSAQYHHPWTDAFVFLRSPCDCPIDRALVDKALKLFVSAQAQHLFAATGCVSLPQIEQDNFK